MNIYITPKRKEELRQYAKEHNQSMSSVIDSALGHFFVYDWKLQEMKAQILSYPALGSLENKG